MTKYYDEKDDMLVERTLLGDKSAYEELVMRHENTVMGTAYKVTGNRYSAEDASQDAFVSAWMNLDNLRDRARFGAWVCSIAKNCARNVVEKYQSTVGGISFDLLVNLDLTDSDESGLAELLQDDNRSDELHEAVEALSGKIREAIRLHYFEGLSVKEIADKLSLPAGTVKWRLSEGRKQLRKGYGVMEKNYDENETLLARVMRQVEELKLWRLKNDISGFEDEYREVLSSVETLEDSREKSHAVADVLQLGYWWIPGQKNEETVARIRKAAEDGHNDDVMQTIMAIEHEKYEGQAKIDFMRETQIPYLEKNGYPRTLGYVYFWMGREYLSLKHYKEALGAFCHVMEILKPIEVYYACAKAAVHATELLEKSSDCHCDYTVTGEIYRKIGNKLYFFTQPGFGYDSQNGSLYWNCARCDSIIYDGDMKPGETKVSSDGKITLKLADAGARVDTPAGCFENCALFIQDGNRWGLTHCATWFCEGVGIVKQEVECYGQRDTWILSAYELKGREGLVPLARGNRWEYECLTPDPAMIAKLKTALR